MPNYDYRCDECGHESELHRVAVADRNKTWLCPRCQTGLMQRTMVSAPGISFKGSGWTPKGR